MFQDSMCQALAWCGGATLPKALRATISAGRRALFDGGQWVLLTLRYVAVSALVSDRRETTENPASAISN